MRIVPEEKCRVKIGEQFGRLTTCGATFFVKLKKGRVSRGTVCHCECGEFRFVCHEHLISGRTKGCHKCMRFVGNQNLVQKPPVSSTPKEEVLKGRMRGRGVKGGTWSEKRARRLYSIWLGMRQRCNNRHNKKWMRYGGRGICICDEWQSFQAFESWAVSSGYSDSLTIDRINNDGNYEPNNCRWATAKEQAANKSKKN